MTAAHPSEPLVGEIRAVRTFRLGAGGRLFPLFDDTAWSAGTTTARCRFTPDDASHVAPETGCSCGLYAGATPADTAQYPHAAHVLAVVALWGGVVVGTPGVRAQYGRVEALWLSDAVPHALARQAAAAYPGTAVFADREVMVREHPPSVLPDYEPAQAPGRGRRRRRVLGAALLVTALVVAVVAGAVGSGAGAAVAALAMLTGVVEVAALGAWHVHRTRRAAATFPAPIGPTRGSRWRRVTA